MKAEQKIQYWEEKIKYQIDKNYKIQEIIYQSTYRKIIKIIYVVIEKDKLKLERIVNNILLFEYVKSGFCFYITQM